MLAREAINPGKVVLIEASRGWLSLELSQLWVYRELLYFLIWRDIKVRYKQTVIGAGWAIFQPVLTMVVFTIVFQNIASVSSDGFPYSIFAFTALLPWNFFAGALTRCSQSVVAQANLVSKVYFPRLIIPLSAAVSGVVDFGISFVVLVGMMIWFGIAPNWGILALPVFLLLALMAALAVGLWLAALNVRYRDVGHTVPFLVQIWLFASPVAYPVSMVPEKWRVLYSLNPTVGVIEGFRWALLGKESPDFGLIAISTGVILVLLFGGLIYFKHLEKSFADLV